MSIYRSAMDRKQEKTAREMAASASKENASLRELNTFIEIGRTWKRDGATAAWERIERMALPEPEEFIDEAGAS